MTRRYSLKNARYNKQLLLDTIALDLALAQDDARNAWEPSDNPETAKRRLAYAIVAKKRVAINARPKVKRRRYDPFPRQTRAEEIFAAQRTAFKDIERITYTLGNTRWTVEPWASAIENLHRNLSRLKLRLFDVAPGPTRNGQPL